MTSQNISIISKCDSVQLHKRTAIGCHVCIIAANKNKTKQNKTKKSETKRNKAKQSEAKRGEAKRGEASTPRNSSTSNTNVNPNKKQKITNMRRHKARCWGLITHSIV